MSRRRPKPEIQFGSDSFLDVIANIVGILIILIVIAGLRVSQTPVVVALAPKSDSVVDPPPIPSPIPSSIPDVPDSSDGAETSDESPKVVLLEPADTPDDPPDEEEMSEPVPPPLPPLVAPQDLVDLARQIQAEIVAMNDEKSSLETRLKKSDQVQSTLVAKQQAVRDQLTEKAKELDAVKRQAAAVEVDMELARETLIRLKKQVSELENAPANVETLEHRITPISRVVSGTEKHYRLEKNRVAEVPVDELAARFRHQLERRKEWLSKTKQHQGEIGPANGFTMHYIVKVETMSDLEALRVGHRGFSISLARWEIRPEPELKGETEAVALKKGSQFYQSILGTAPDTTLTFWVYPDSYPLFRKLQKFAHEHGYSVAARPLPHGVHIAGSPNGSKSASQ